MCPNEAVMITCEAEEDPGVADEEEEVVEGEEREERTKSVER